MLLFLLYLYISVLVFAFFAGLLHFQKLDLSGKILFLSIAVDCINELIATVFTRKFGGNLAVYNVHNLVWFTLIAIYFNYTINHFKRWAIGFKIAISGLILGVANLIWLQPINSWNTYFYSFQGIVVISMSLFNLAEIFQQDDRSVLREIPSFWIACIFCFFWCSSFTFWGLYPNVIKGTNFLKTLFHTSLIIINIITYASFSLLFFYYPKMMKNE